MSDEVQEQEGLQMSFLDHLDELRKRLIHSAIIIGVSFALCFYFSDYIFKFLSVPIKVQLRKARIEQQKLSGNINLDQLKDGDLVQYTFAQESSVNGVPIPLGTTIRLKAIRQNNQASLVLSEPWSVGKSMLPVGKPLNEILSGGEKIIDFNENDDLVITKVGGAFTLYITVAIYAGIAFAIPLLLYQVWAFIAPGLYKHEKRYAVPVLLMTATFFTLGAAFAYRIAFPRACDYLLGLQQSGGFRTLINAEDYFDLIIMIMIGLGIVFQIPTLAFLLGRIGLITPKMMFGAWRYAIIVIAIIAALLTPTPDAMNMLMFALPMLGLYFISIGIVWLFGKKRQTDEEHALKSAE